MGFLSTVKLKMLFQRLTFCGSQIVFTRTSPVCWCMNTFKVILSHLFADNIYYKGWRKIRQRRKQKPNKQRKEKNTWRKKVNTSEVVHLQPDNFASICPSFAVMAWKQLQNKKTLKAEWKRNRAHTLVAHHQVRQTLKGNKSTVSNQHGCRGKGRHGDKKVQWQTSGLLGTIAGSQRPSKKHSCNP